ncbi:MULTISPECIES: TIGR04283 family arsenosugar biosynthesis glycosyltransferase [Limnospira]|uniref:4,4'-diaponeurosporenoate glycosyltransferase n=1 Tax=Limnospira indica PCC 8005 TaxID=376219 RepID=A0A9P1KIV2_9CYAN|nr:TIGR04283 family arsenosugar biosynthesis glycosyltransferase [Limnospira indica]CDM97190.1 Glycosyl transferase, family 2 [Limnospira indica PCC 8005]
MTIFKPGTPRLTQPHSDRHIANIPQISIIIPVLNEAQTLPHTLKQLQGIKGIEVIVVDGGSQDETVTIAQSFSVQVITTAAGKARQMNAGAAIATGDTILFLHGDTQLPDAFNHWIEQILRQPEIIAGAFELEIAAPMLPLRWVEFGVKMRSHYCQLPYGDQALFMKTQTFRDIGGFPDLPIMEDFALVRQLQKRGKIAIAPVPVITSARRWEQIGILQTTLINQIVIIGYLLRIPSPTLSQWYRARKRKNL